MNVTLPGVDAPLNQTNEPATARTVYDDCAGMLLPQTVRADEPSTQDRAQNQDAPLH